MKNRSKKGKKVKNNNLKGFGKKGFIRIFFIGIGVVIFVFVLVFFLLRPKLLWYVDEDISADWNRILRENPPPFSRYEVISRLADDPFPKGRFGFVISRRGPDGEHKTDFPVTVFNNLSQTREYKGWFVLALDPWMVFHKHRDLAPQRSFLDNENRRGSILLAGNDKSAVQAWLCQLLQDSPGSFKALTGTFEDNRLSLVRSYPFQSDALSYSWMQVWPEVYRNETVYLYAPLSQAMGQPPWRIGLLGTTRFPDQPNWDRYGLEAEILWAGIQGDDEQKETLLETQQWLKDPLIQTAIANTFLWIPAHPNGYLRNTISSDSHIAWRRSSYIWQGAYN